MGVFQDWLLLPERLAVHEPTRTAVLADLHLGYNAVRQRLGDAIPGRTIGEELFPLARAAQRHDIRELIVAGDLFEKGFRGEVYASFLAELQRLKIRFVGLVLGNHDRGADAPSANVPILKDGFELAGWRIVHGDQPLTTGRTVMGHWHPAIRWKNGKAPCFLASQHQLVLPAFSLDAAGAVVADPRWTGWQRHVIVGNEVRLINPTERYIKKKSPR